MGFDIRDYLKIDTPKPFFLTLSILFTIYALDLLILVIISLIAKSREGELKADDGTKPSMSPTAQDGAKISNLKSDSANSLHDNFPKVLIQLPMYNEEACADLIIERCCKIKWPRDKLLIQVLDDSTKENVRKKVDDAALACAEKGHPVQVLRRTNRSGYKAGAMVVGLEQAAAEKFIYVAIFDADFDPPEDFLYQTVSRLQKDPKLGFVQTRWVFSNANTFLTWAQKVNLNFHFEVEQRARSFMGWFFNFNGTAGTWRIEAITDAGGWESDTVVEDMDLSLRAYLKGWSSIYLDHVHNINELPASLSSYKTQQFRWLSGPMQVLGKAYRTIWTSKNVGFWRKANSYWFFTRYILFAVVTLAILCVPPAVLFFEKWSWRWEQIWFIVVVNLAMLVYLYMTPFSLPYLLFSIAVGYFKTWAMLCGLFGSKKSKSWKVTAKAGATSLFKRQFHKPYFMEFVLFMYYGGFAGLSFWMVNWLFFGYCVIMSVLFLAISLGDYYM